MTSELTRAKRAKAMALLGQHLRQAEQLQVARKMLAALKDISDALYLAEGHGFAAESRIVRRAIKLAEDAGITTGEDR